jgi:thiamine biosynthesis protein ThiI
MADLRRSRHTDNHMTRHAQQYIVLHYGEMSLKGQNRPMFVRTLMRNVQQALSDLGRSEIVTHSGRLLLTLAGDIPWDEVASRLGRVFGLANFAPCLIAPHDLDAMKQVVDRALAHRTFASFRVTARRAFKDLPFPSQLLNQEIGTHVLKTHTTRVDLEHPELTVYIELIPRRTLIYVEKLPGAGGLPVGTGGRLLSLLSGGLDSPVASYRMMKRGCQVDFVHFHSYPFLDRTSQEKARQLAALLTRYQYAARLFLVPFGDSQQRIVSAVPPPYRVILYRRCMLRIAEALAQQTGALALVTGESLGQVASQTLQNLRVIQAASTLQVLRPLIGMDKAEIMHAAQAIGTFAISVLPDQDCCTLFVPRHPTTGASLAHIEALEQALDIPALVDMALSRLQTVTLSFPEDEARVA